MDLETRLRAIEDHLAILNLIASHPLTADSAASDTIGAIYADDGVIDLGPDKTARGNAAVAAMVLTEGHQAALAAGLAHFASLPHVTIEGERAVAYSYLQILAPHPNAEPIEVPAHGTTRGFRVHRVGANRWELERAGARWKIKRRTFRFLDGNPEARALVRGALPE